MLGAGYPTLLHYQIAVVLHSENAWIAIVVAWGLLLGWVAWVRRA